MKTFWYEEISEATQRQDSVARYNVLSDVKLLWLQIILSLLCLSQ